MLLIKELIIINLAMIIYYYYIVKQSLNGNYEEYLYWIISKLLFDLMSKIKY